MEHDEQQSVIAAGGNPPKEPKIPLIHPHTKDRVEVDESELVPWMVKGYVHAGGEK